MRIYLAGPISEAVDPVTWRLNMAKQLSKDWEIIDPTQMEVSESDDYNDLTKIIRADLSAIRFSHAVIARIDRPSWGTGMEIFYAHSKKIPVIGWYQDGMKILTSPWIKVHCNIITSDFREVQKFLQTLLAKA
jgi:nucleoside 2-deoxyribosyltransferase